MGYFVSKELSFLVYVSSGQTFGDEPMQKVKEYRVHALWRYIERLIIIERENKLILLDIINSNIFIICINNDNS